MNNFLSFSLIFGVAAAINAHAVPFAYKKNTTLFLRELPLPVVVKTNKKNDESIFVDSGVGNFTTTATGVIYQKSNRLEFATFNNDPKKLGDGIKYQIDSGVSSYDVNETGTVLAYIKRGDLWVKDSVSPGPGKLIQHSVDFVRVNQGRVYFAKGYRNFVLDFVIDASGYKKAIITRLENVSNNSVLGEQ